MHHTLHLQASLNLSLDCQIPAPGKRVDGLDGTVRCIERDKQSYSESVVMMERPALSRLPRRRINQIRRRRAV